MSVLKDVKVGQTVVLQINNEGEYSGTVDSINNEKSRIYLADVIFKLNKFSGIKKFYVQEIDWVKIVCDVESIDDADTTETSEASEVDAKGEMTTMEYLLKHAYEAFDANLDYCRTKSPVDVQVILRNEKSIEQRISLIPPFKLNVPKKR